MATVRGQTRLAQIGPALKNGPVQTDKEQLVGPIAILPNRPTTAIEPPAPVER
jgi:hypothetical protein